MKISRSLCCFIPIFISASFAQSNIQQKILDCTTSDVESERLECYDAIANELNSPSLARSDNWQVQTDVNPVDDSKTVVLATVAEEGQASFGDPIILILRCQSEKIDAYINWNEYLGLDNTQITYRIGTADAKTDKWYISTNNQSTFYSQSETLDREFISSLAAADNGQLVAKATPYGESPKTAIFNISGLDTLLDRLYEPCS